MLFIVIVLVGCQPGGSSTPAEQLQEAGQEAAQLLNQVQVAAQQAQYSQALALVDNLIQHAPDLPQAYYERGLLRIQLRQFEAADQDLAQATDRDFFHRGAWYQRGHVAFEQRKYREAIGFYQQQKNVIKTSPRTLLEFYEQTDQQALPQIWLQVGRSYELLNVPDSAKWAYLQVLGLDSTHAQAHSWLGELLKEEGALQKAQEHGQKAMYYNGSNPEFAYNLGMLYFEQGDLQEAIPLLDRVVAQQPWNASAHYNLGRSLVSIGRTDEGQKHLGQVDQLQDLDQRIEYARAAVAQFPDEPARWRQLAQLLGQSGRVHEQQQVLQILRGLSDLNQME